MGPGSVPPTVSSEPCLPVPTVEGEPEGQEAEREGDRHSSAFQQRKLRYRSPLSMISTSTNTTSHRWKMDVRKIMSVLAMRRAFILVLVP